MHEDLETFILKYNICKICNSILKTNIYFDQFGQKEGSSMVNCSGSIECLPNKAVISIKNDYYVYPNVNNIIFTLSIENGNIFLDYNAVQFINLYGLKILINKDCENCRNSENESAFGKSMSLSYDLDTQEFNSAVATNYASFDYDGKFYVIMDFFGSGSVEISCYEGTSKQEIYVDSRVSRTELKNVKFDSFNFGNIKKLVNKINSLILLA